MKKLLPIVVVSLLPLLSWAQETLKVRPSPLALATARFKDGYIKITYSQPQKKGREVFGKLVPFGQVWRTGANEATEITVTKNISINNVVLKPGTYTLFSIPNADRWTIIINSDFGLWGAYNYNAKLDVMRFDVPVQTIPDVVYEAFTIQFDQKNEVADLLMLWNRTKVVIPIKFLN